MKRIGKFIVVGVAGLALAGCNKGPAQISQATSKSNPAAPHAVQERCNKTTKPSATGLSEECLSVASTAADLRRYAAGKIGVIKLDQDVQAYILETGFPPRSLDDLVSKSPTSASRRSPDAKAADLIDPFGHAYGYLYPGKHGRYDITFYGRDGKAGGKGINRDSGNWEL